LAGEVSRLQRIADNDADDKAQRRAWFLFEASRSAETA
jgi:hypothetical protein